MSRHRRKSYRPTKILDIPEKANRILNIILIAMFLIILRVWHLAVIQYDEKLLESRKPQRRVIFENAKRATIRDRFNIPLAINKIQYKASILYSQIRQIPFIKWETDHAGKRIKKFKRKEYITALAGVLGKELQLDPERLEDLIHSKASFYSQVPFVIKEDLSEQEYYRLKILEKDWLGIYAQSLPKRYYPKGKLASDVIGYMGAINRKEYDTILQEIKTLEEAIETCEAGEEDPIFPKNISNLSQARKRLKDLVEHAYTITDYVGKTGVEGHYEQVLRGFHGKKSYYSDARGNFLRELPGSRDPIYGQRILLTISSELQEYAEKLLAQNEQIREARVSKVDPKKPFPPSQKQPWIKGGAVVAMDPNTGEVLALASYPRYDPNDFITSGNPDVSKQKRSNICRWFENETYLAEVWNQKRPLERELYDDNSETFYEDQCFMHWDKYLDFILYPDSDLKASIEKIGNIKNAITLQKHVQALIGLSGQDQAYPLFNCLYYDGGHQIYGKNISHQTRNYIDSNLKNAQEIVVEHRKKIDSIFSNLRNNYDKVLLVDLCRLAIDEENFSEDLLEKMGDQTLAAYRDISSSGLIVMETVQTICKRLFHDIDFKNWRKQNEKDFLKQKRTEEKAAKIHSKPFIDYLDSEEQRMFETFWSQNCWTLLLAFIQGESSFSYEDEKLEPYLNDLFLWYEELANGAHINVPWRSHYNLLQSSLSSLSPDLAIQYLQTFRGFDNLNRPLLGRYRSLRKRHPYLLEKDLAAAFYPNQGYGYGRSQAYRQATTQGSIFKLVTAYEALIQKYEKLEEGSSISPTSLNPLTIVDQIFKQDKSLYLGFNVDGKPIPQMYKGGRLLKSHTGMIGKVDLLNALENSSNPYFSLLAGDVLKSPSDLSEAAKKFSYGSSTGIDLPGEISGKVPDDLESNRTGLYAMANGQHSLVVTPLQTSVMLSAIANKGRILKPKIVALTVGKESEDPRELIDRLPNFRFKEALQSVGIDFPLFVAENRPNKKNFIHQFSPDIIRKIWMPDIVRNLLLEGMNRVVHKQIKDGLSSLSKLYREYPEAISDYFELKDQLIGKSSTSESMENIDLDLQRGTNLYTHVWFGGITFDSNLLRSDQETFLYRDQLGKPELVIVVYLRFGAWGKEAAPLAAQIVKKWKEIKTNMQVSKQ